jgi:major membrane immunogen (membrane-anchored lipoprotein)
MRRWRSILTIAAVAVLAACGTDPEDSPEGVWELVSVAGKALPAPVDSVTTFDAGTLKLAETQTDSGTWSQVMNVTLADGTKITAPGKGTWARTGGSLSFVTADGDKYAGTYKPEVIMTGPLRWERP